MNSRPVPLQPVLSSRNGWRALITETNPTQSIASCVCGWVFLSWLVVLADVFRSERIAAGGGAVARGRQQEPARRLW
jgi:hypothetical protein